MQVCQAISKAIDFLHQNQMGNGEFTLYVSGDERLGRESVLDSSPSVAAFVAFCTRLIDYPKVSEIRQKALDFLTEEMEAPGVWRFYTSRNPKRIDPDLDDTCWISFVLREHRPHVPLAANIPAILANRNRHGLFGTWLRDQEDVEDVESVVNANVAFYLGEREETRPVCEYLNRIILENRERDSYWYYLDDFSLYYAISRAFCEGVRSLGRVRDTIMIKILQRQKDDGSFGSDWDTASAVCALLNFGCDDARILDRAVRRLVNRQMERGSWRRTAVWKGPAPPHPPSSWWGSEELTAAISIEALTRYLLSRSDQKVLILP